MTSSIDVVNRALQKIGTRTTIASLAENSNEAIQAGMILDASRDELLRKAPWNCSTYHDVLTYITSVPGTPENSATNLSFWAKGQPPPGWAYMYQYPVDCLRALFVVPQLTTGFAGGVPITQATTGTTATTWRRGPPIRFSVAVEKFFSAIDINVVSGGSGHADGDVITFAGTTPGQSPIGAPAKVEVISETGGVIDLVDSISIVNVVQGQAASSPLGGSYFNQVSGTIAQGFTTGSGTGATFTVNSWLENDQRVILTQQENAILCYIRQVTDVNVMDPLFHDAWTSLVAARLSIALTGDKTLANMQIALANESIVEARKADGNEGLTVQDHTPDWIRTRGTYFPLITGWTSDVGFDWGNLFPSY